MRTDSKSPGRSIAPLALSLLLLSTVPTASSPKASAQKEKREVTRRVLEGRASWYGPRFHGRRTASGERFNRHAPTLASRGLPFGTRVRITNLHNGRSAVGRVNDRGPFIGGRIVDLSEALAQRIGMRQRGVARVRVEVLGKGKPR